MHLAFIPVFFPQDAQELTELSKLTNYDPIFFVRVPAPGLRTVDTDPPDGCPGESTPRSTSPTSPTSSTSSDTSGHQCFCASTNDATVQTGNKHTAQQSSSSQSTQSHPLAQTIAHPLNIKSQKTLRELRKSQTNISKTESDCEAHPLSTDLKTSHSSTSTSIPHNESLPVEEQLKRLGLIDHEEVASDAKQLYRGSYHLNYIDAQSVYLEKFTDFTPTFSKFMKKVLQTCVVNAAPVLNTSHTRGLNMFIISAFDMARDMLITPKKLEFAKEKEDELYKQLMAISVSKLGEIKELISNTISVIGSCLVAEAGDFELIGESWEGTEIRRITRPKLRLVRTLNCICYSFLLE